MIVLGCGVKAIHSCYLYNLFPVITQFYETPRCSGEEKLGRPVRDEIILVSGKVNVVTLTGDSRHNRELAYRFDTEAWRVNQPYNWVNLIHEQSIICNPSSIGYGVKIRPYSIVCSNCVIGNHVDIGNHSNVGHDTVIGDYTVVGGQAAISGCVTMGEGVLIGQGASIKPDIRIGNGAVVGTGAVVVKDVAPNMVVAGNPAKSNHKFKAVEPW